MGLSASEARVLLLTSKSNSLELQAQKIEQERLVLSQQQEDVSQAFTDATSNQIFVTSSEDKELNGKSVNMTTMAQASPGGYIVASSTGTPLYMVVSEEVPVKKSNTSEKEQNADGTDNTKKNDDALWETVITYYKWNDSKQTWEETKPNEDRGLKSLTDAHINNQFQKGLESGALQLFKVDENDTKDETDRNYNIASVGLKSNAKIRSISLESSDFATSKYYTEDDAAAQAAYQTAMTRINILDTRLENKLNALEKDKKAVDTEKESAQELVKKKTEGFKYFS